MANSSPKTRQSYRAAVRALNRVAAEESSKLCAVIEDPRSTENERLSAIQALGSLAESLILRMANLEEAAIDHGQQQEEEPECRKAA